ncbi:hypothetical protein J3R82DRAFT_11967 [Butyriboletus roseoflavus]|nr:hypothetical protein J3R82DRAFT_11967 [Butyriboletus roseoflavus]
MSFPLGREKTLPDIPVDIDAGSTVEADEGLWLIPSCNIPTSANTNKALPSINVENTLSEGEMSRLHELWNGAGLSARAHRRRRHGPNPTPRRIPAPISIPDPEDIPIILSSAGPSTTTTTPSTTVARKRWGFRSARPFSETQEAGKKVPNALEKLRVMAQDRLKKKLRYAKSAPNLGDQAAPTEREVTPQPPVPMSAEAPPRDVEASSPRTPSSPSGLATPEAILQPEDVDENAIYFTIDPNWRASQGSVQFQFITPIPDSPISFKGRSDSPLLHRHYSLDQLSFAAQEATTALTTMEFPDMYPSDEVLHPIDELHAYLEL